jgi:predicted amidohydrolase YtcJ
MDFSNWNPYLGMKIGMTRWVTDKTMLPAYSITDELFEPAEERMGIEEMILGHTINGAFQLGIENTKGSITVGKDADFLVFDEDLLTAEPAGLSHVEPVEVHFGGTKVK